MIKRLYSCVLLFSLLSMLFSCGDDEVVLSHCELCLALSSDYREVESDIYDAVYSNGDYVIAVTRISFVAGIVEGIPETMSDFEFAEFYLDKCSREATVVKDEVTYASYVESDGVSEHFYLEAFYRSPYAYFVVLFASDISRETEANEVFLDLAERVRFTN